MEIEEKKILLMVKRAPLKTYLLQAERKTILLRNHKSERQNKKKIPIKISLNNDGEFKG